MDIRDAAADALKRACGINAEIADIPPEIPDCGILPADGGTVVTVTVEGRIRAFKLDCTDDAAARLSRLFLSRELARLCSESSAKLYLEGKG